MKIKKIILLFVLIILTLINVSYAANDAIVSLSLDTGSVKKGEEFFMDIKVGNVGVTDGVYSVMGELGFNNTVLEIVPVKVEELGAEQQQKLKEYETLIGLLDVLYFDEKCLIGGFESEGSYLITVIYVNEEDTVVLGKTETMGKIQFKALDSTATGTTTTSITLKETIINDNLEAADSSATISVLATQTPVVDPGGEDENWIEPEIENEVEEPVVENEIEEEPEQIGNEIDEEEDIPDLGAEDYIPFIIIFIVVAIISYNKYIKYRGI